MNEDPYILNLKTFDGFCTLFYRMCSEYSNQELAYDACERIFIAHFNERRFANWNSFKNYRNQKLRERKKKSDLHQIEN